MERWFCDLNSSISVSLLKANLVLVRMKLPHFHGEWIWFLDCSIHDEHESMSFGFTTGIFSVALFTDGSHL